MRLCYFLEYRYDDDVGAFKPIGVWMHNPADGDVDIFYVDPECPEAEEANWIMNRLVEAGLKTPDDFLEFHATRTGYHGMRGPVREVETELSYDAFGRMVFDEAIMRETNADSN